MKKRLPIIILFIFTLLSLTVTHIYIYIHTTPDGKNVSKTIIIPKGVSFRWIAGKLDDEGIIQDTGRFTLLAEFKGVPTKVKAGEYELHTSMLPVKVLERLLKGNSKEYTVTIPEGYNIYQIAKLLDDAGLTASEEFIKTATNKDLTTSLGIEAKSAEGYLFPDTYRFTKAMGAKGIIRKMVNHFNDIYSREIETRARDLGLSREFIVTIASMIEKEAGVEKEKPLIATVFYNRLKKGMRLESDPTVIYGIKDFDGNLKRKDLKTMNPYNTYLLPALPYGPISNPGRTSLLATLNPAKEKYLFFVSRNDGTHQFSNTLREHSKAVRTYQK
ncbi:MAG: endolytic transglycosylase MltG [Thermodesulfobacteriota bacterium]